MNQLHFTVLRDLQLRPMLDSELEDGYGSNYLDLVEDLRTNGYPLWRGQTIWNDRAYNIYHIEKSNNELAACVVCKSKRQSVGPFCSSECQSRYVRGAVQTHRKSANVVSPTVKFIQTAERNSSKKALIPEITKKTYEGTLSSIIPAATMMHLAKKARINNKLTSGDRHILVAYGKKKYNDQRLTSWEKKDLENALEKAIQAGLVADPCPYDPCARCKQLSDIISRHMIDIKKPSSAKKDEESVSVRHTTQVSDIHTQMEIGTVKSEMIAGQSKKPEKTESKKLDMDRTSEKVWETKPRTDVQFWICVVDKASWEISRKCGLFGTRDRGLFHGDALSKASRGDLFLVLDKSANHEVIALARATGNSFRESTKIWPDSEEGSILPRRVPIELIYEFSGNKITCDWLEEMSTCGLRISAVPGARTVAGMVVQKSLVPLTRSEFEAAYSLIMENCPGSPKLS